MQRNFYQENDVVAMARKLIGKHLFSHIDGVTAGGMIVETEAYDGLQDRASHAYGGRRTRRTSVFYEQGGVAYVYLCYGIHALFNIITGEEEVPHAVLIRAIMPTYGIEHMLTRRNQERLQRNTAGGPALICQSLGIRTGDNRTPLDGDRIWLKDTGAAYSAQEIETAPRVGIGYAGEHANLPWRFFVKNSRWTSPAR